MVFSRAGRAGAVRWCDRVDDRGACGGERRRESGGDPDPGGGLDRPVRLVPAGGVWGGGEGAGFWACGGVGGGGVFEHQSLGFNHLRSGGN